MLKFLFNFIIIEEKPIMFKLNRNFQTGYVFSPQIFLGSNNFAYQVDHSTPVTKGNTQKGNKEMI